MVIIIEKEEEDPESNRYGEAIVHNCRFCRKKKELCKKFNQILKSCDICSPLYYINRWLKTNVLHDLIIAMYLDESASLYKFANKYNLNKNTIKGITKRFRDANENGFKERIDADMVVNPDWDQETDTTRNSISYGEIEEALQILLDVVRNAKESDEFLPKNYFKS